MKLELFIKNQLIPFTVEIVSIFVSIETETIIFREIGTSNDRVVKMTELNWWKIR